MNRKPIVFAGLLTVFFAAGAFALTNNLSVQASLKTINNQLRDQLLSTPTQKSVAQYPVQSSIFQPDTGLPKAQEDKPRISEAHLYLHLFKHIAHLVKKTADAQARGESVSYLDWYKREAMMTGEQVQKLQNVALECLAQVQTIDAQAAEIIADFHRNNPPGQLAEGQTLPPPPTELVALEEQRGRTVLEYKERLRTALNESGFAQIQQFIEAKFAPNVKVLPPQQSQELRQLRPNADDRNRQPPQLQNLPPQPIVGNMPQTTINE